MKDKSIKYLWIYSKGLRGRILCSIILSCLSVAFSILFVETTNYYLDFISSGKQFSLEIAILLLIGFKIFQLICEQSEIYIRNSNRIKLENRLEYIMFCKLMESSQYYGKYLHSGDSIYRLSSDAGIVAEGIAYNIPILIYAFVQLIGTWSYLMVMQPVLTIIIGAITPLMVIATYYYTRILDAISREVRKNGSAVNEYFQEHIQHSELISVLEQHQFVQSTAKRIQKKFLESLLKRIRVTVTADSFAEIGFAISYLVVFIWGLYAIPREFSSYGTLIVFLQLIGQLQRPF